ncbi:hypothetical protein BT67DRAFT_455782 [Trichocladium antarcticum]|uniref:Ankyrin repeat protein n=1 Tax=Trichocladium antarcticum TaxID=1450529 RepID=A0AAN6ZEP9_9PEZI|nr:hypothetical protein BT67DRAFT_455782 [Trichocladium antarcticum]
MAETATLTIRHHSPGLPSRKLHESRSDRTPWTPRTQHLKRPTRLRQPSCRELVSATDSLPAIHLHSNKCSCTKPDAQAQLQDAVLARKIATLTQTAQSLRTPKPQPKPTRSNMLSALSRLFSAPAPAPATRTPPTTTSGPLQADLCTSCATLDIHQVARYLMPGTPAAVAAQVHVDARSPRGTTPLAAVVRSPAARAYPRAQAAMGGPREEVVKGLRGRTRGSGSHRRDRGRTPENPVSALHLACNSAACTRALLDCGAAVDVKDGHGRTPLRRAADAGNADVVRLLVDAGAEISLPSHGITPSVSGDQKRGEVKVLVHSKI